jgi:pimeloyl-ACP methyl ester carboxylesterase
MTPVVLVHGWGGSFETTWRRPGFAALLEDAGRPVLGVDLLGHGDAPKPHDPAAYADLTIRIEEELPAEPVDAVGFSLGALTLLRLAIRRPDAFHRLVLAGIGGNVLEPDHSRAAQIAAGLQAVRDGADLGSLDQPVRIFVQYALQPGNDLSALTAVMQRAPAAAVAPDDLARVTCPVLVVIGDRDVAAPGDPLAAAFPDGRCVTLPRVDHFRTPEDFGFVDATLEFLDAV